MYSVVWVTVGLLPLWHDLKIHIISSFKIVKGSYLVYEYSTPIAKVKLKV